MHPAFSVIFFTTTSGAGYGLLFVSAIAQLTGMGNEKSAMLGLGLSFVLISAGLLSSTFHLGHPERAWRAFSQWRSSWLSREGVLAVLSFGPMLGIGWGLYSQSVASSWMTGLWLAAAMLSVATVYATAMIYRSLRSIERWSHPLVVAVYLSFALMSGVVLWLPLAGFSSITLGNEALILVASVIVAWLIKLRYWQQIDEQKSTSSAASATGLVGEISVFDPPHTEDNYLLTELGHQIARKHSAKLRRIASIIGLPLVSALLLISILIGDLRWSLGAVPFTAIALLIERWLFFAEAEHSAMLYYRADAAYSNNKAA